MPMIVVRLLGSVDVRDAGGNVLETLVRQPKRLALLSYLAAAAPRGFQRRETLIGLFWPDSTQDHARNALSQALHVLRRELGQEAILTRGDGEVALSEDVVSVDVWALEAALAAGELEGVVSVYRGQLLNGLSVRASAEFEHWLDAARNRLWRAYVEALEQLAEAADQRGDRHEAVEWRLRLVEEQPYNTQETLCLMRALDASGDRAGALVQAARHTELLLTELAAAPSPDVTAYAERLRQEPVRHAGEGSPMRSDGAAAASRAVGGIISDATRPAGGLRWNHPVRTAALFGVGAVAVLAVAYMLVLSLGLPRWVYAAAVALVVVILPVALARVLVERPGSTTRVATATSGVRAARRGPE